MLRKLTHEGDNEPMLLPSMNNLLESFTRLLSIPNDGAEIDDADTDEEKLIEQPTGEGRSNNWFTYGRENDIIELKSGVLAVLLNLTKYSSKTSCRLPAHPVLMRRLFGLVMMSDDEEPSDERGDSDNKDDVDIEGDEDLTNDEQTNVEGTEQGEEFEEIEEERGKVRLGERREEQDTGKDSNGDKESDQEEEEGRATKRQKISTSELDGQVIKTAEGMDAKEDKETRDGNPESEDRPATTVSPDHSRESSAETPVPTDKQTLLAESEEPSVTSLSTSQPSEEMSTSEKSGTEGQDGESTKEAMEVDEDEQKSDANSESTKEANDAAAATNNVDTKGPGAREKLRKMAGLVLSKLADDNACCEALSVYDGVIVQIMLLASEQERSQQQGVLAALMHKLLLSIGVAASS